MAVELWLVLSVLKRHFTKNQNSSLQNLVECLKLTIHSFYVKIIITPKIIIMLN